MPPSHIDAEVVSAIVGMLKGSKVDDGRARRMIGQFKDLRIRRHPIAKLGDRIVDLRHDFTVYEAGYVALAEYLRKPLLTTDAKFSRAPSDSHSAQIDTFTV